MVLASWGWFLVGGVSSKRKVKMKGAGEGTGYNK